MVESPYYRLFRHIKYPLPYDTWRRLPRLLTHKSEYWDGHVRLSPRPRVCNVCLPLDGWSPPPSHPMARERKPDKTVAIRILGDGDWPELPSVFNSAFADQQPLYSWRPSAAHRASRAIMRWTQLGRDGPLVRNACFVAMGRLGGEDDDMRLCGCAIVTLAPIGFVAECGEHEWMPHPEDPTKRVAPHLDWMFVSRWFKRGGVATMLLGEVVSALRALGCHALASTFPLDNAESMQWHWRNGFALPSRFRGERPAARVDPEVHRSA